MLACITCEKVILLTTGDNFLRVKGYDEQTINLFLPTVCFSCERDERKKVADEKSDQEITTAMWTSLPISWDMMWMWQPYSAMNAFPERESAYTNAEASLVQRNKIKDIIEPRFAVQSMLLNPRTGVDLVLFVTCIERNFKSNLDLNLRSKFLNIYLKEELYRRLRKCKQELRRRTTQAIS